MTATERDGVARFNPLADKTSREFSFRSRRFANVQRMIEAVLREKDHCEILDLGGTEQYWKIGEQFLQRNCNRISITLVNLEPEQVQDSTIFSALTGDATDPDLLGGRIFDLFHSNSVIEHVGDDKAMQAYADNVRRLAPRYYVQTPNYWFPYEPHFRLPMFQYLPEFVRVQIIRNFAVGFFPKVPDPFEAWDIIRHHRMIAVTQMRAFFPDAEIAFERFGGMNKSIMAMRDGDGRTGRLQVQDAPLIDAAGDLLDSANQIPPKTKAKARA